MEFAPSRGRGPTTAKLESELRITRLTTHILAVAIAIANIKIIRARFGLENQLIFELKHHKVSLA